MSLLGPIGIEDIDTVLSRLVLYVKQKQKKIRERKKNETRWD